MEPTETIALQHMSDMRREFEIRSVVHRIRQSMRLRSARPDVDVDELAVRIDATDTTASVIAPLVEAFEILKLIIYASDGCQGHRGCAHSMEPWKRARALMIAEDEKDLERRLRRG